MRETRPSSTNPTFRKEQHMRSLATPAVQSDQHLPARGVHIPGGHLLAEDDGRRTSQRMRSVLTRVAVIATLGMMAVLSGPVAAQAAAPDHEAFHFSGTFVDDEVCAAQGFAVTVTETDRDDVYRYFNADGSFKQTIVHLRHDYLISANGHTINLTGQWQVIYYPDGSRSVGLSDHVAGVDGYVVAGQIVFNEDGSVAAIHGSHLQVEGQSFCTLLLP